MSRQKYGLLFCLSNPSYPGVLKIGIAKIDLTTENGRPFIIGKIPFNEILNKFFCYNNWTLEMAKWITNLKYKTNNLYTFLDIHYDSIDCNEQKEVLYHQINLKCTFLLMGGQWAIKIHESKSFCITIDDMCRIFNILGGSWHTKSKNSKNTITIEEADIGRQDYEDEKFYYF